MAIASSGALAMSDLSSEFGGSGARSLSDYYAGAGLVASLLTDTVSYTHLTLPTNREV